MGLGLNEWYFAVHDSATGQNYMGKDTSGWLMVCNAGLPTSPTIYTDSRGTSTLTATNTIAVVSIANGYAHFWTASTVTSLDVSFLTATGECGIKRACAPKGTHMLRVDTDFSGLQTLWVPFAFIASSAFVDTTLDLPADLEIYDANVRVVATDASATVDWGFKNATESGDEDGLLDGMPTDNAGLGVPNPVITNDTVLDYYSDALGKYGALLGTFIDGASGTTVAAQGGFSRKTYLTNGTITSLGYTPSNSDTMTGFGLITYRKLMG